MKIILIGNFRPDRQESMLRFEQLLAEGMRARGHEVETWAPEPVVARLLRRYRYDGPAKYFGYFDKFVAFPSRVRLRLKRLTQAPDVVHIIDHANAVYASLFQGLPLLGTCHDLLQIRAARGEFPQQRLSSRGKRTRSGSFATSRRCLTSCAARRRRQKTSPDSRACPRVAAK